MFTRISAAALIKFFTPLIKSAGFFFKKFNATKNCLNYDIIIIISIKLQKTGLTSFKFVLIISRPRRWAALSEVVIIRLNTVIRQFFQRSLSLSKSF